jgi:RNA polymerase sigma-70 factor (ECF subfamily)
MVAAEDRRAAGESQTLLARARMGDTAAFGSLIENSQTRLFQQAVALCGDPAAAEDLVEETLIEAWRCLRTYNGNCKLSTWLYAILLHRHQKARRRARSRPGSMASLPAAEAAQWNVGQGHAPAPEPNPAERAARNEEARRLRACVERLPEKHRHVILLRFFEDASLPDMASVLNRSVGTVKSRLHHALDKLRAMQVNLPPRSGDT